MVTAPQNAWAPTHDCLLIAPAMGLPSRRPKAPTTSNSPRLVPILSKLGARSIIAGVESDTDAPERKPNNTQKIYRPGKDCLTAIKLKARTIETSVTPMIISMGLLISSGVLPAMRRPNADPAFAAGDVQNAVVHSSALDFGPILLNVEEWDVQRDIGEEPR